MNQDIYNNPAFRCIEKERLEKIKALAEKARGKSVMEVIDIFSKESNTLTNGKPLTKMEQDAIAAAMMATLSDADKARFSQMLALLNDYSR